MNAESFKLTREFDASKDLVWRTWTEADLVQRWYGPGVETVIHEFEVKPGGLWLNEMRMGERSMNQRMEFTEVSPTDRLVILMSNADENWEVTANPMMPDWPRTILTTVTLEDREGGGTLLTLDWTPHEATDAERAAFAASASDFNKGWGAGMNIIDEILAELS
ncbi:MAG: SRPBCC domain-containing protein [Boseongicola sp. SB0673_bin_14]|nr:SRPBCC domain-containing protein [Boseongicola sp. SB0673_bin_14]